MKGLMLLLTARRVGWAVLLITFTSVAAAVWWDSPLFALQSSIAHPPRPIFVAEAGAIALGAVLPGITAPTAGFAEQRAGLRARLAGTTLTTVLAVAVTLPLVSWYLRIPAAMNPDIARIGLVQFIGSGFTYAAIGIISYLLLGPALGPVLAIVLQGALVAAQGFYPYAWPDLLLNAGRRSQPPTLLVLSLVVVAIAIWHIRRGASARR